MSFARVHIHVNVFTGRPEGLDRLLMAISESEFSGMAIPAEQGSVSFEDLLVAVGQKRNRDAFIRLFEYFAPRVKSFLLRGGMNADQAEDLAQETMMVVWNRASSYDPLKAAASTWIFTIARNRKIDFLRKSARPEPDENDPLLNEGGGPAPDEAVRYGQQVSAIRDALSRIPEEQAELLEKSFFEGKTHQEIAAETDLPLGTVKSRIRLALERMRYILGGIEL